MYFRDGNFESASLHVSLHVDLASSASVASWIYWASLAAVASWISLASYILGFVEEQWLVCFLVWKSITLRASRRGHLVLSAGVLFVIVVLFAQVCRRLYRHAAMKVVVLCAPWSPAGPRKSLDTSGVVLFVGALLSWLPVLANLRIPGVIGGGVVCSAVAGGAQKIA